MGSSNSQTTYLQDLPELVLLHVGSFLPYVDIIHLSMTCQRLKSVLPSFSLIKGSDLHEPGPSSGHWVPSTYFDGPRLKASVQKLIMSMTWKDQVSYLTHT